MKKVLTYFSFIFAFIFLFGLFCPINKKASALSEGGWAKVVVSRCYLYTSDNFSSEKVSYQEENDTILVVLSYGDSVSINNFSGDFAFVTTQSEKQGYIYKYYITDNTSQNVYPVFNASIRRETPIYDIDKNQTEWTAKKGARVFIYEGFNDKNQWTAVQIVLEDESLYNGYVKTEDIKPDGVSGLLIVAISIIIAAVTIIMSLLYIKKKKKKKKV